MERFDHPLAGESRLVLPRNLHAPAREIVDIFAINS